jgi:hypothetical protein
MNRPPHRPQTGERLPMFGSVLSGDQAGLESTRPLPEVSESMGCGSASRGRIAAARGKDYSFARNSRLLPIPRSGSPSPGNSKQKGTGIPVASRVEMISFRGRLPFPR